MFQLSSWERQAVEKTSLVRYLANTCGVKLCTFNFHAGRSEEEIIRFIKEKESHARKVKEQIWIFSRRNKHV